MPISVSCGGCGKKMRAPDSLAGKRVKCPGCGRSLAVAAPASAPPPPPEDDNPFGSMYAPGTAAAAAIQGTETAGESAYPGTRRSWSRVNSGLNLLRFGVVLRSFVTMAVIAWLGVSLIENKPFMEQADKEGKIVRGAKMGTDAARPALNFLAMPLTILGLTLAVAAPMARGAKLLALLALFLALFMLLLYCPGNVGVFVFDVAHLDSPRLEAAIPILNIAGAAGAVAEFMQFFMCIFFLRACAVTFNQPRVASGALMLLVTGFLWIALACGVGAFVVISMGDPRSMKGSEEVLGPFRQLGQLPLILAIALNVLGLFWLLHYFITISRVRGVIVRNLFRLAPE